jgi:subtilisin-like proprotein convertase family protein
MQSAARAVLWFLAGCLFGCSPSVDYDGTEYRCNESGSCPDGYDCRAGFCVAEGGFPDAGDDDDDDDDDDRADAKPSSTMLRASSEPEVEIPDDFDQGIVDAVEFDTQCSITDITVEIDITHDWPGDLMILMQSPSQTEVVLHDQSGGEGGGGDGIVGTYPVTLTPEQSLDVFLGENSRGPWLLWVADVDDGDTGTLNNWAVNLWCD